MQKMRSIGINGGELKHFLGNFNLRFCVTFHLSLIHPMLTSVKGVGGGPGRNFFFLLILIANLVYFHPLFTEFENHDPKVLNFADLSGWVGPQVVNFCHLEKFNVQRVKKRVRNCT